MNYPITETQKREAAAAWAAGEEHPAITALQEEARIAAAESGADRELDFNIEEFEETFIENALA